MKKYFWAVRALGYSLVAGLIASALVTRVGTGFIFAPVADSEEDGESEGESDGEDEDSDSTKSKSKAKKRRSKSKIGTKQGRDQVNTNLLANNVFCPECVPLVEEADAPPVIDADGRPLGGIQPGEKKSSLPLRLLVTMESPNNPEFSQASIRDEETGGTSPYWPGDVIQPGVLVMSIERGLVHLRNGSSLEYLMVGDEPAKQPKKKPKKDDKKKPAKKKKKNDRAIPGAEDAINCDESGNQCTVERAFVEKLLKNPMALAKQARVIPSIKDGENRGFKFYGIRKGSLPRLLNLKNGDLLTSVN
ncbi:MAG: type II secretion system protein GspC, partial [Nannocystaceae bacterium]